MCNLCVANVFKDSLKIQKQSEFEFESLKKKIYNFQSIDCFLRHSAPF